MFTSFTTQRKTAVAAAALVVTFTGLTGCASVASPGGSSTSSSAPAPAVNEEARSLLPSEIRDNGTLTVASGLNYPPFEYTTAQGVNEGMDIDLVNALGQALGLKIEIVQTPFENTIAGLTNNRYDIGMATFTITKERRQQVNFVQFLTAGSVVSVQKGTSNGIEGTSTLCGHKVGVITGSAAQTQVATLSQECAKAGEPQIDVSVFQTQSALVQGVLNGRVDAKLDDSTTSDYVNKQVGGKLMDVGDAYDAQPTGFAVARNQPELLKSAQVAMQGLIDDGVYKQIAEKWGQTKNTVSTATIFTENEPSIEPTPTAAK